jgi:hypothetical protein
VFTLSLSRTEGEHSHFRNGVHISTHLNPKFKPTTATTKACATYESVKIATLERGESNVEDEDRHELCITQALNGKTAYFYLGFWMSIMELQGHSQAWNVGETSASASSNVVLSSEHANDSTVIPGYQVQLSRQGRDFPIGMVSSALHTSTIVPLSNPYTSQDREFHVSLISQASHMSAVRLHSFNVAEVDTVVITFKTRHTLIMPAMFSSLLLIVTGSFRVWDTLRVWMAFLFAACVTRPTFHHATTQHAIVNTPLHRKCSQRANHSVFMSGNLFFCNRAIEAAPTNSIQSTY